MNCVFLFVYRCMLWAILCFASITFLPGIASPTSDLYLVIAGHSKTLQIGTQSALKESCQPRRSHVGPISPHWNGSRPTQSCLQYVTCHQETESDGSRTTYEEVTQAKVRMNVHQRWALIWRDVGFCALIPSVISSPPAYRCNSWETTGKTPHTVTYTTVTNKPHAHAHTHNQSPENNKLTIWEQG